MNYFEQITLQLSGAENLDGRYKRSRLYREIQLGFQMPETRDLLRRHARYSERIKHLTDTKEIERLQDDFNAIVRYTKQPRD